MEEYLKENFTTTHIILIKQIDQVLTTCGNLEEICLNDLFIKTVDKLFACFPKLLAFFTISYDKRLTKKTLKNVLGNCLVFKFFIWSNPFAIEKPDMIKS